MATMDELIEEIYSRSTSQGSSSTSPFQRMRRGTFPGHFDHRGHLPTSITRSLPQCGFRPTSGSRFLTTPKMSLRLTVPLQSSLLGGGGGGVEEDDPLDIGNIEIADGMPEPEGWP